MKKVTEKELETLQTLVNTINEAQAVIGGLEIQKQAAVREAEALIADLKATQKKLEKKYGDITVSLATGEITGDADNPKA
jgi:hypothetical protein